MTATNVKTYAVQNLRWASDRAADGKWRAYAWLTFPDEARELGDCDTGYIFDTEREAFEELRQCFAVRYRQPKNVTVTNDRGDTLSA